MKRSMPKILLPFVVVLLALLSFWAVPIYLHSQADAIQAKGLSANDAKILREGKEITGTPSSKESYVLSYNWSIPDETDIKNGDTMTFELPTSVQIIGNIDVNVNIKTNDGHVVGNATIGHGQRKGVITLTNVENFKKFGRSGTLNINVNGVETTVTHNWVLAKSGWTAQEGNKKFVQWQVLYNSESKPMSNVVVTDTLSSGQKHIKDSVQILTGTVDENNNFHKSGELSGIDVKQNGQTLTFNLGNISTAIEILYRSQPDKNFVGKLTNDAHDTNGHSAKVEVPWGGNGNAEGYAGEAKLTKVDSKDSNLKLANAEFKLIDKDNNKLVRSRLITDKNGNIDVSNLSKGHYAFIETKAPGGYKLNSKEYPATISGTKGNEKRSKTSFSVNKVWDDQNDKDKIRPKSVKVQLYANHTAQGNAVELSSENKWNYTWSDLYAEDENGKAIKYSVKEVAVPNGYTSKSDVKDTKATITNIHVPKVRKTSITVNKKWDDQDNKDKIRSKSVKIQLLANGEVQGNSVALNAENNWSYSFNDLPAEDKEGKAIKYSAKEENVTSGYQAKVDIAGDNVTITNVHVPKVPPIPVKPKKHTVVVRKNWDDANDEDGIRPKSVKVQLYKNGKLEGASVELNAKNNWSYAFKGLLDKDDSGKNNTYTVKEVNVPAGYQVKSETKDNNVMITNVHVPKEPDFPSTVVEPKKKSILVRKVWDDANNKNGIRPNSIKVQLYANGTVQGKPIILDEDNGWSHVFKSLQEEKDGQKIDYAIKEVVVPKGYQAKSEVKDNSVTITNIHTPDQTKGEKIFVPIHTNVKPKSPIIRQVKNVVKKINKEVKEFLPQTGNSKNNSMIYTGIVIIVFALIIAGVLFTKKK